MIDKKIVIDFAGAMHGNFAEYVINSWIAQRTRVPEIFTELGTCHLPRLNLTYCSNRMVECAHYSENNLLINDPEKVIRITLAEDNCFFWVYQINSMFRPGDIGIEKSIFSIRDSQPVDIRRTVYSKLIDSENSYNPLATIKWRWNHLPVFNFPMESFYNQITFYEKLTECANFLKLRFIPDEELSTIHKQFMDLNQGWHTYTKGKKLVAHALSGQSVDFESNEIEQAMTNALLTKSVGIFDGPLFESNDYPTNTIQIWEYVNNHLKTFDSRF
jgi:hypothetical protein